MGPASRPVTVDGRISTRVVVNDPGGPACDSSHVPGR